MFEKKFNAKELYILHVSELIYYVPFDTEGVCYNDYYTREYYTVASSKDELNFKDVFKIQKYKSDGYVGFGVMRDIKEMIPLKDYDNDINDSLNRQEIGALLEAFVEEINNLATENISESEVSEVKKLELLA